MPERLELIAALDTVYKEICEAGKHPMAIAEFLRLVHYVGCAMNRYSD